MGQTMYFKYNPGQDTYLGGDTWNPSGSVSSCNIGSPLSSRQYICTADSATTSGTWTHYWKIGATGATSCSKTATYTINNPRPPTPTITTPSCIFSGYNESGVTISWTTTTPAVTYVDISTASSFSPYYNKAVSNTSTTAPDGFSSGANSLTLNTDTTYYVRTWNGSLHSNTATFSIPLCVLACPDGLEACGDSVPSASSIGTCNGTWQANPGVSSTYNIWCAANAGPARGYCYRCNATPWIQASGDVHSNERINAQGGPEDTITGIVC
ncbi:hypothetical protein KKE03_02595, partial [Patescibacteria group bacterium]|nr:hypothetical protein [Patescibacteria group bacterium]